MKRQIFSIALTLACAAALPQTVLAADILIPVGKVVGLELRDDTVTVAAFDDALSAGAKEAGLQVGDEILTIDGVEVDCTEDVRSALKCCDEDVELLVQRDGKQHRLTMAPADTAEGKRLGVYLRQGIAGIGTITYYDPESGDFGALGHAVSDSKGKLLDMTEGSAYQGRVQSVMKGKIGTPGQLRGAAVTSEAVAILEKNTPQGVFGTSRTGWSGQPLPVGKYEDVKTGKATIRSTVAGDTAQEYSVEILKIYPKDRKDNRNFLLRVTDPKLLEATGGIVQGMSGSPILQNGRIVGAVTHVLVNDPTTGYGIFIENMLEAADAA